MFTAFVGGVRVHAATKGLRIGLNAALEGRYTGERELGEGGMATVYLALTSGRREIERWEGASS